MIAPAGDHIGTGLVERLIQRLKRTSSILNIDPKKAKKDIREQNFTYNWKHKANS